MSATTYPGADTRTQWFGQGGPQVAPQVIVLHTTEGTSWDPYNGGKTAPHLTARPDLDRQRLVWRQHFPLTSSARALQHPPGTVETNNRGAIQVELVGTCSQFGPGLHWPSAPDWALAELAAFLAWAHCQFQIPLGAPLLWPRYPRGTGARTARMGASTWLRFRGVCGHLHVPNNDHGDPGDLPMQRILAMATDLLDEESDEMPLSDEDVTRVATKVWQAQIGRDAERATVAATLARVATREDLAALRAELLAAIKESR